MSDRPRHTVNLDVSLGRDGSTATPSPDDPFCIAFLGDFRARSDGTAPGAAPLSHRPLVPVDRYDLDEVLARFLPRLSLDLGGGTNVELTFSEPEHFHPDEIYGRAPLFRALREARARLTSPDTFQRAIESILGGPQDGPSQAREVGVGDVIAETLSASALDRVIDQEATQDSMRSFLRGIVAPHVVTGEDLQREAVLDDLDRSVARVLRDILHHPRFQALESLWWSVRFLVTRLESGTNLKVLLLDVTAEELRDGAGTGDLARALNGAASILLVDHAFGANHEDLDLLRELARLAADQGSAMLAGARPDLLGLEAADQPPEPGALAVWEDEAWEAFRRSAEARTVGLVLPRFLMRVPYGPDSDPCDQVELQEMDSTPAHRHFLWGSGAIIAAVLLGESFAESGWRMRPGQRLAVSDLPLHTWRTPDGAELQPCVETLISDQVAESVLDAGPMALVPIRHGDVARLLRFQSIASPPQALDGPWSRIGRD
ncbi:MAG: type VI secretion system contractile sheath large subunit [Gemmatimonadota bacterium]